MHLWQVDICLFTDDVGESTSETFNGGHREHDISCTINIGILNTKNVLKLVGRDKRHFQDWVRVIWKKSKF